MIGEKSKAIQNLIEYVRAVPEGVCIHKASEITGFNLKRASTTLTNLTNKGVLTKAYMKATCKYSDKPHTWYIFRQMPQETRRRRKRKVNKRKTATKTRIAEVSNQETKPKRMIIIMEF